METHVEPLPDMETREEKTDPVQEIAEGERGDSHPQHKNEIHDSSLRDSASAHGRPDESPVSHMH